MSDERSPLERRWIEADARDAVIDRVNDGTEKALFGESAIAEINRQVNQTSKEEIVIDVLTMIDTLQHNKRYGTYWMPSFSRPECSTDRRYIRRRARRCGVKFMTLPGAPRLYVLMMGRPNVAYKRREVR